MKHGFARNEHSQAIVKEEQESLFEHVPQPVLRNLCGGFGAEVWRNFESARDDISEDDIRMTCLDDPKEVDGILDQVEALL